MSKAHSNMYDSTLPWNPFKGCDFDCTYCVPSFKKQAKRQRHVCEQCYQYTPHCHEDRLADIPSKPIVFVAGNADISFCPPDFTRRILASIRRHIPRSRISKTYYFQSKQPEYFEQFLGEFPPEVILVTTLETNRDDGYDRVSKAPVPSQRCEQFRRLDYPRKVVTIEPVLDFDLDVFSQWIIDLGPEYVWLGFNSRPKAVSLPEPTEAKVEEFAVRLIEAGVTVREKTLRGVKIPVRT